MKSQHPEIIAAIAASMPSAVSRRRLLQAAGISGAAMVAAACGAGGEDAAAGSGSAAAPSAGSAEDKSDTDKAAIWSNWPLYIDIDDTSGARPSLDAFQKETGITVTYTEDINDNNEFFAKVRTQLEQGQDIGRDLVVLTDWMAALWINNGYAQKLDKANIPNAKNVIPKLADVPFDPGRQYSLPWQSGFGVLGWNTAKLKEMTGKDSLTSVDQLFDPKLKGRVTVLSEMRDTMGILLAYQGADPTKFTEDQWQKAIELLTQQVDSGQIRQVTGNDYISGLDSGDLIAVLGWSGDVLALGEDYGFALPESGGLIWADSMIIPTVAPHKANAERLMDFYYDPEIAAQLAAYIQYVCPVAGAQEAMARIDPEMADDPWVFPPAEVIDGAYVTAALTSERAEALDRAFDSVVAV